MRISSCLFHCWAAVLVMAIGCSEPISVEWRLDLEAPSVSTPLVTDGYIAVGSEVGLHVVELDGSPRCFFDAHGEVISAPKTDGSLIFFGSTNYILYAVTSTCTEKWKFATQDRIKSDPLVHGGRVYVSSYDGHVYALAAPSGSLTWSFPSRIEQKKEAAAALPPGDFSYSSPTLADGVLYLGNLDHHLYAIRATDGTLLWRFKTQGPVTSTPRVAKGVAYFGSNDGNVYALAIKSQPPKELWKLTTQDWVNSSAQLTDGAILYIGSSDRKLYAINTSTGHSKWAFGTQGPVVSAPVSYKNLVFAGGSSGDGSIYAVDRETGKEFWRYTTGAKIDSDLVVVGDKLYVSSADNSLYAFSIARTTLAE